MKTLKEIENEYRVTCNESKTLFRVEYRDRSLLCRLFCEEGFQWNTSPFSDYHNSFKTSEEACAFMRKVIQDRYKFQSQEWNEIDCKSCEENSDSKSVGSP